MTLLTDYDSDLPQELIAQSPVYPKESAKMLVVNNSLTDDIVGNVLTYLEPGDVLVLNNSKVFRARLSCTIPNSSKPLEVFLIRPIESDSDSLTSTWSCLARPRKKVDIGTELTFGPQFSGRVVQKPDDGTVSITFYHSVEDVFTRSDLYGAVPTPPYIHTVASAEDYQTVYAKRTGSVAAPTAGLHFTAEMIDAIRSKGVITTELSLHVGLGTFLPVTADRIEDHVMHAEWVDIPQLTWDAIKRAKSSGKRVVAIGTTVMRALEGAVLQSSSYTAFSGDINCFITPGFHFQCINLLLTNFHLPKSTLLMLVSAFGGYRRIREAYTYAIKHNYRFFSFGDCMLLYPHHG